jgi:preprotein translocase subunit YajC
MANKSFSSKAVSFVKELLLGESLRVAKDIGTGIRQKKNEKKANMEMDIANNIVKQAMNQENSLQKQRLLKEAINKYQSVGEESKDIATSFSKNVNKNPIMRGLRVGTEIASIAGLAGTVGKIFTNRNAVTPLIETIKQRASVNVTKESLAAQRALELGTPTKDVMVKYGSNAVQAASQRLSGKPLIADFESAINTNNLPLAKDILKYVSSLPKGSVYEQYIPTLSQRVSDASAKFAPVIPKYWETRVIKGLAESAKTFGNIR